MVEYAGGYSDWAGSRAREIIDGAAENSRMKVSTEKHTEKPKTGRVRKLTFREQRELDELPETLSAMEEKKEQLHRDLADPDLYTNPSRDPGALTRELSALEEELDATYIRWQELEEIASS